MDEEALRAAVDVATEELRGALLPWPPRRPLGEQPRDDEYSRVTDPGRYELLDVRARAWERVLAVWAELDGDVLRPRAGGVPLRLERFRQGELLQLRLAVGDPRLELERVPDCGCDACDFGWADLCGWLDELVLSVVRGRLVVVQHPGGLVVDYGDGRRRWDGAVGDPEPLVEQARAGRSPYPAVVATTWWDEGMTSEREYGPSPVQWVRDQVELYESSGGTRGTTLRDTGLPVVILTTVGVRSGKVRKTPLMRVEHHGVYAAIGSQGGAPHDPLWCRNLLAHPDVVLQDGPKVVDVRARLVHGAERQEWWQRAVEAFPPYASYQERTAREIPVFLLEPVPTDQPAAEIA